jgi:acetyl-CoA acyltransferase 2
VDISDDSEPNPDAMSVFLVAAKRTPFGAFGGALKAHTATDLAVHAAGAALRAADLPPALVDACIVGNVAQTSSDAAYISRHVALRSGLPVGSTALTVNRLCGSGFEAVVQAARDIRSGDSGIVLAVGTESMSQAPLSAFGQHVRFGHRLGADLALTDTLWSALTDSYCNTAMGLTAENVAAKHGISRVECDEYAARSQRLWKAAHDAGVFARELAPVELPTKKGKKWGGGVADVLAADEHPRPSTTPESLARLATVFKPEASGGVVTAGGSSGICDGVAALVVAGEAAVRAHGLTPLARVAGWAVCGVDPTLMGLGPVPAIRLLLSRTGLTLADIDRFEVNEAFAAQVLGVERELGLDRGRLNVHGGAIALGHPLGASGARIIAHLAHVLAGSEEGRAVKRAVGAACIGGGQGIAVLLERV